MIHYFFQAEKSSSSHRMSNLFEKERNKGLKRSFFQSDDGAKECRNTGTARKHSMLRKEFDDDDDGEEEDNDKL